MKKIFLITVLLFNMTFVFGQKENDGKTEWSSWKLASPCFPNLFISYKCCGWTSSVNKYCYNFRIKNSGSKNIHFNLDIKFVSGEEYTVDGRFDLTAGEEYTHVSMYYDTKPIPNSNNFFTSLVTKYIENQKDDWAIPSYSCNGNELVCDANCNTSNQANSTSTSNNTSSSNSIDDQIKELTTKRNELCKEVVKIDNNMYNNVCDSWQGRDPIQTKEKTLAYLKEDVRKLENALKSKNVEVEKQKAEEERFQKEKDAKKAKFDDAIQNGDNALNNKQYDSAMSYYGQAKSYSQDSSEKSIAESKYNQAYEAKRSAAREERLEKQAERDEFEDKAYVGMATGAIGLMALVNDQYVHKYFSGKFQIGMGYEQMPLITNQNNEYAPKASYSDKTSYPTFHFGLRLEFLNNKLINLNTRAYYSLGFNPFETGISGAYSEIGFDGGIQFWYKKKTKFKLFADVGLYKRSGNRTADLDAINDGTTATDDVREGEYSYSTLKLGAGPMFHLRHDGRETWIKPGLYFEKISFAKEANPTMSFSLIANIESEILLEFSYSKNYPVAGTINYANAFTNNDQNFFAIKLIRQGKLW